MTIDVQAPSKPSRDRRRERELKDAEQILGWYFTSAESSCGIRSSFEAQRLQLAAGSPGTPSTNEYDVQHFTERVMLSIADEREVSRTFALLASSDQEVLSAYFSERQASRDVRALLGEASGLLRLVSTEDALLALVRNKDRTGFSSLKRSLSLLFQDALGRFSQLWQNRT